MDADADNPKPEVDQSAEHSPPPDASGDLAPGEAGTAQPVTVVADGEENRAGRDSEPSATLRPQESPASQPKRHKPDDAQAVVAETVVGLNASMPTEPLIQPVIEVQQEVAARDLDEDDEDDDDDEPEVKMTGPIDVAAIKRREQQIVGTLTDEEMARYRELHCRNPGHCGRSEGRGVEVYRTSQIRNATLKKIMISVNPSFASLVSILFENEFSRAKGLLRL